MNISEESWLSVPEAAQALGVKQRDVRNMLADRKLIAIRRGESNALAISTLTIVERDGDHVILPSLRGTLVTLADGGFSDDEAWRWLTEVEPELGERPIDALRSGRVHAVRRIAAMLAF